MAKAMDRRLGVCGDSNLPDTATANIGESKQKDGSLKLKCPVLSCPVSTYKLRRHIDTQHSFLKKEVDFSLKVARIMEKNKARGESNCIALEKYSTKKKTVYQNTNLVNRKSNYKQCALCSKLCINMSDHVRNTHKIPRTDPRYNGYVQECQVIPKCFTTVDNGIVRKLEGDELANAKSIYSNEMNDQQQTLDKLKGFREEMSKLKSSMENAENEEYETLKVKWNTVNEQYKKERYKDTRVYSDNMVKWRDGFLKHLKMRAYNNPERGVRMAVDVILPFETNLQRPLTFDDLLNGETIREILGAFKETKSTSSTSKIKYLTLFEWLITYLSCDVSSPERKATETNIDLLANDARIKTAKHEIKTAIATLSKNRGADLIKTKKRAQSKLVDEDELKVLLNESSEKLLSMLDSETKVQNYDKNDVIKIRNLFIAVATIRLGRRSKEILKMTVEEVNEAKETLINEKKFYIINVLDQKNTKTAEPAPIALTEQEFKGLKLYISSLRKKLVEDSHCNVVFPPSLHTKTDMTRSMSFSSAYNIMQKFQTKSGKKLSSRSVRGSLITNSRKKNISANEKLTLAKAMSHSLNTAERYYNYDDTTNSVVNFLTNSEEQEQNSEMKEYTVSGPGEPDSSVNECTLSDAESPLKASTECIPQTSTPSKDVCKAAKRKLILTLEDAEIIARNENPNDETLKTLRNKKIKYSSQRSKK